FDDHIIAQSRFPRGIVVLTVGTVAVVEVGCNRNVALKGEHLSRVRDEVFQPRLAVDDDGAWNRAAGFRRTGIYRHVAPMHFQGFPRAGHLSPPPNVTPLLSIPETKQITAARSSTKDRSVGRAKSYRLYV